MVSSSQLTAGSTIKLSKAVYRVENVVKVTVTKGNPFYKTTLIEVSTGKVKEKNFKPGEKIEEVNLSKRELEFLYPEGKGFLFLSADDLEQIFLEKKVVGGASNYLKEGVLVTAFCYEDSVCALEIPQFLELMVTQTDVIDDTVPVSNATKLAVLETGAKLDVPPFVEVGDIVKVDTLKNDFVQRV
ncbi:MAG: elongation factor P [Chlamydiales bacterium]|nr:elongation factor P [Chlamydiales bacterium]NCF71121.1 elongation factor P [Chlamydiales bacterium]